MCIANPPSTNTTFMPHLLHRVRPRVVAPPAGAEGAVKALRLDAVPALINWLPRVAACRGHLEVGWGGVGWGQGGGAWDKWHNLQFRLQVCLPALPSAQVKGRSSARGPRCRLSLPPGPCLTWVPEGQQLGT